MYRFTTRANPSRFTTERGRRDCLSARFAAVDLLQFRAHEIETRPAYNRDVQHHVLNIRSQPKSPKNQKANLKKIKVTLYL